MNYLGSVSFWEEYLAAVEYEYTSWVPSVLNGTAWSEYAVNTWPVDLGSTLQRFIETVR